MASTSNLSSDITALIVEYYEKQALTESEFTNDLLKRGINGTIPEGNSDTIHWHRWSKFALAADLSQGVDPAAGQAADATDIKGKLILYGDYIDIPLFGDAVRLDSLIKQAYKKFIEQASRTANRRLMTSLVQGDNSVSGNSFSAFTKRYAGNVGSFGAIANSVNVKDIQRAVAFLEQNQAPRPIYAAIDPWTKLDLMLDADFRDLIKHTEIQILERNNLPMWAGATLDRQDDAWRESSASSSNEGTYSASGDIVTCFVYSNEAYGKAQLMGSGGLKPNFHVQNIQKTGQVMSIGYYMPFKGVVLNANWGVQLRGKVSNSDVVSVT